MERKRNMPQVKEWKKSPEKELSEIEARRHRVHNKGYKELRERMDELSEKTSTKRL